MEDVALQAARFLHYTALVTLFGTSLFPIYAFEQRRYPFSPPWFIGPLPWSVLGLITACLWLVFSVSAMAGAFGAIMESDTWRSVLFDMAFGWIWGVRTILAAALVCLCLLSRSSNRRAWSTASVALLSGILLATLSTVGHARVGQVGREVHTAMDALHLLAAGAWIGGLVALLVTLREPHADDNSRILLRFSQMGFLTVAALAATGLVNGWFLVGTVEALLTSHYGHLLIIKLAAFLGMVMFAAANRFWLVPAMENPSPGEGNSPALRQMKRHVSGELALGVLILMVVSVLGSVQPAAH